MSRSAGSKKQRTGERVRPTESRRPVNQANAMAKKKQLEKPKEKQVKGERKAQKIKINKKTVQLNVFIWQSHTQRAPEQGSETYERGGCTERIVRPVGLCYEN